MQKKNFTGSALSHATLFEEEKIINQNISTQMDK